VRGERGPDAAEDAASDGAMVMDAASDGAMVMDAAV
jgi:hypothetical protein